MNLMQELEVIANKSKEADRIAQRRIDLIVKVNETKKALEKQEELNKHTEREVQTSSKELEILKVNENTDASIVNNLKLKVAEQQVKIAEMQTNLMERREKFCEDMEVHLRSKETHRKENGCPKVETGEDEELRSKQKRLKHLKGEIEALELFVAYQRKKGDKVKQFVEQHHGLI